MMNAPTRSSRSFLALLTAVVAIAAALPALAAEVAKAAADKPNILVIFDDQLRADVCGVYGGKNITTPGIDRLAKDGVVFENALSICPVCTPFRGMLQTGRYPSHTGIVLNWVEVNPRLHGIANIFDDAGYRTGFIGKWHLAAGVRKHSGPHAATPEDRKRISAAEAAYAKQNPETEYVPPGPARLGYQFWQAFNFHANFQHAFYYEDTPKRLVMPKYETESEMDMAIAFMRQQKETGQPFLLMVAPHPPHPPFSPKDCPEGYLEKIPKQLTWAPNVPDDAPRRKNQLATRCYYAMAKHFDDQFNRVLDFLDESGLADNTIVVLTSDHGEMLGSHRRSNKMVPYREAVKIPCIVRWPGHIPAGRRLEVLQTPMDHLPTLCTLAGLRAPADCDGMDLSTALLGTKDIKRDAVLMANYVSNWDFFDSGTNWPEWRAVRTPQYTYVKWLTGKEELYDDVADPYQMKDLAAAPESQPVMKSLRTRLKELLAEAHDEFLPGTEYASWYDDERNLIKTGLGPVGP